MKQSVLQNFLSAWVILMAVTACALPNQATPSPPAMDLAAMETSAVDTAQAAATQTTLVNPATSTPLPIGVVKEQKADGSILLTDYDGGYQITFPKGWVVIIPNEEDISEALSNFPEQEENISRLIEAAQNADTNNMIRAFGFNPKAQQSSYTPNINVSHNTNSLLAATSLKDLVDATVQYYSSGNIEVLSSEVKTTTSGVEIGVIEMQLTINTLSGDKLDLRQRQVMTKSEKGIVNLTFSTVRDATIDLTADVDEVIESFQLLNK